MNAFLKFLFKLFSGLSKNNSNGTSSPNRTEPTPTPKPKAATRPVSPTPAPSRPTSFGNTPAAPEPEPEPTPPAAEPTAVPTEMETAAGSQELRVEEIRQGDKLKGVKVSDGSQEGSFRWFDSSRNSWKGWYTSGQREIKDFVRNEPGLLRELNMTQSGQNLLQAVSDNEGKLEAINAYDGAFLSFGIFQWTLGTRDNAGELPALLKKVKNAYPAAFAQNYGRYGLGVSDNTNGITGFLTLDGERIDKRDKKEQFRSAEWVYRFWRAGLNREIQAVELDHALSRLRTFYWRYKVHGFTLNQIITSEYGVALLLDNHVNLPALVRSALEAAMNETGLTDPTNWGTAEERRVLDAYIKYRATKVGRYGPMHDAMGRAKRTAKYLDEGVISAERNSFVATTTSTRGFDDLGNYVPEPEDFNPADYPEVELETEGRDMEFLTRE